MALWFYLWNLWHEWPFVATRAQKKYRTRVGGHVALFIRDNFFWKKSFHTFTRILNHSTLTLARISCSCIPVENIFIGVTYRLSQNRRPENDLANLLLVHLTIFHYFLVLTRKIFVWELLGPYPRAWCSLGLYIGHLVEILYLSMT